MPEMNRVSDKLAEYRALAEKIETFSDRATGLAANEVAVCYGTAHAIRALCARVERAEAALAALGAQP